jgi:hypothetical protein
MRSAPRSATRRSSTIYAHRSRRLGARRGEDRRESALRARARRVAGRQAPRDLQGGGLRADAGPPAHPHRAPRGLHRGRARDRLRRHRRRRASPRPRRSARSGDGQERHRRARDRARDRRGSARAPAPCAGGLLDGGAGAARQGQEGRGLESHRAPADGGARRISKSARLALAEREAKVREAEAKPRKPRAPRTPEAVSINSPSR